MVQGATPLQFSRACWSVAVVLASFSTVGAPDPKPIVVNAAALEALLSPILTDHARTAIAELPAALKAALVLGSPDFMRR